MVTVTNPATGCASISDPFVVVADDESAPAVSIVAEDGIDTLTCDVNRTVLIATVDGDDTDLLYTWSGGNNPDQARNGVTTAGTYTVTVTNPATGCESISDPFVIVADDESAPTVSIVAEGGVDTLNCDVNRTVLIATVDGDGTDLLYTWSGGNNPDQARNGITTAGTYTVTVTNPATGCASISDPFVVVVDDESAPAVSIVAEDGIDTLNCDVNRTVLIATVDGDDTDLLYTWSGGNKPRPGS